jgi:Mrp family chromosome partitioning ATPase
MAKALDLNIQYGIDDVLAADADESEVGRALTVARIGNASVGVLALRRHGNDLADRLSLPVAENLIRQLRALSDFVVIDSPPLTAVGDALPLARLADDVLVVARRGYSKLSRLWDLRDILVEQATVPTGIIMIGQPGPRSAPYYAREDRAEALGDEPRAHGDRDAVV